MRVFSAISAGLILAILLTTACSAQVDPRNRIVMRGDNLVSRSGILTLRSIQTPRIGDPAVSQDEIERAIIRRIEVGANSICFNMTGYNEDGTALDAGALERAKFLINHSFNRRVAALCNPIPQDAPDCPVFRMNAARTAATELKNHHGAIYVFTGPDSAALAREFSAIAPDPVTAAEGGGTINIVRTMPENTDKPLLLLDGIPPAQLLQETHILLPDTPQSYTDLDMALANPVENAPWTPDNSMLSQQERDEGFISMFDGKTLDGWWVCGQNQQSFAAEDGMIVWKQGGGNALYTRDRYDNFILRLEWKINENGNSGIFLRAPRAGRQSMSGMEFQLMGDHGKPITNQSTGSIYSVVPPELDATKPNAEWNELEIILDGPVMKATLNGQVVQNINLDQNPELEKRLKRGFIGLQDHGRFVAFRNIRIKQL